MFGGRLGTTELLIILAVVLLLFGATRLPKLAQSMGQAMKEFRKGANGENSEEAKAKGTSPIEKKRKA